LDGQKEEKNWNNSEHGSNWIVFVYRLASHLGNAAEIRWKHRSTQVENPGGGSLMFFSNFVGEGPWGFKKIQSRVHPFWVWLNFNWKHLEKSFGRVFVTILYPPPSPLGASMDGVKIRFEQNNNNIWTFEQH
jgi:hypothetical protein